MEGVERKALQALPFDSHGEMNRYLTRAASSHILSILLPKYRRQICPGDVFY